MAKEDFQRISLHRDDSIKDIVDSIKMFTVFKAITLKLRVRDIKKNKKRRNKLLKKYRGNIVTQKDRDLTFVDFHDNDTVISVTDGIRISYALTEEINRRVGLKLYEI